MPEKARYHHGNLRPALIDAGVELARAGGPDAVVVREASRRVGVSHNAAYRHFPDRDALLRAVAERSMSELARLMERLMAEGQSGGPSLNAAQQRLRATGRAYVRFALEEPGLFRTAFAVPRRLEHFGPGEGVGDAGLNPYELLNRQLDELMESGGMPPERRLHADVTAWAAVHGLSMLMLEGPLRELSEAERQTEIESLLDTLERGLTAS